MHGSGWATVWAPRGAKGIVLTPCCDGNSDWLGKATLTYSMRPKWAQSCHRRQCWPGWLGWGGAGGRSTCLEQGGSWEVEGAEVGWARPLEVPPEGNGHTVWGLMSGNIVWGPMSGHIVRGPQSGNIVEGAVPSGRTAEGPSFAANIGKTPHTAGSTGLAGWGPLAGQGPLAGHTGPSTGRTGPSAADCLVVVVVVAEWRKSCRC